MGNPIPHLQSDARCRHHQGFQGNARHRKPCAKHPGAHRCSEPLRPLWEIHQETRPCSLRCLGRVGQAPQPQQQTNLAPLARQYSLRNSRCSHCLAGGCGDAQKAKPNAECHALPREARQHCKGLPTVSSSTYTHLPLPTGHGGGPAPMLCLSFLQPQVHKASTPPSRRDRRPFGPLAANASDILQVSKSRHRLYLASSEGQPHASQTHHRQYVASHRKKLLEGTAARGPNLSEENPSRPQHSADVWCCPRTPQPARRTAALQLHLSSTMEAHVTTNLQRSLNLGRLKNPAHRR
mmetsp:Transcript_87344/g.219837  ORF Transcript_87344/g.219837 Transcript_87344/m.219837 type:complete len:294 (-) Transcript_87344:68-949(-)